MSQPYTGPSNTELRPDDDIVYQFLREWFATCNHGCIELGWTDPRTGKLNQFRRFDLDAIIAASTYACEVNERPGCNLYFRPATVQETPADGHYTRDVDVVQIPGTWVDCDTASAVALVLSSSPSPSIQVITGRQPELRSQFLWSISEPILAGEWSKNLNRQAAVLACGESDPMVVNPSTLLRLPGSIAWPYKQGRLAPEPTELIQLNGKSAHHSYDALRRALPQIPVEQAGRSNSATTTSELLNPARALLDQARAGPLWHEPVLRAVAHLVGDGYPDWVILAMAGEITWPNYTVSQTRDELAVMIEGAKRRGFAGEERAARATEEEVADVLTVEPPPPPEPILWIDGLIEDEPDTPRDWVVKPYLLRGNITSLFGQPGLGKSTLALAWAILLALNPSKVPNGGWGGFETEGGKRVVIFGLEEDRKEQRRRIKAILQQFGANISDLGGRLRIVGSEAVGTLLKLDPKTGDVVPTPAMRELRTVISEFKPDALFADPMAEMHSVEENSNALQRIVTAELRSIARAEKLALGLIAHSPKGKVEPGNLDALRGAGAIGAAIRFGFTVCGMSEDDAKAFAIPDEQRDWFFRLDRAKGSYSPPARAAKWFERLSVAVGEEAVGSCRPWTPPAATGPSQELLSKLLSGIAAGCPGNGAPWSPKLSSEPRSVRHLFIQHGIDLGGSQKLAMASLFNEGVSERDFEKADRKTAKGLRTEDGLPKADWVDE